MTSETSLSDHNRWHEISNMISVLQGRARYLNVLIINYQHNVSVTKYTQHNESLLCVNLDTATVASISSCFDRRK